MYDCKRRKHVFFFFLLPSNLKAALTLWGIPRQSARMSLGKPGSILFLRSSYLRVDHSHQHHTELYIHKYAHPVKDEAFSPTLSVFLNIVMLAIHLMTF